jgi:hypothetical protein
MMTVVVMHHAALALHMQVSFENNVALNDALDLRACTAIMTGSSTFLSNTANKGAVSLGSGASLDIRGPLCAQGNAGGAAGFLFATDVSRVTFSQPATACINGNTPVDVKAQGADILAISSTDWKDKSYTIIGGVCACDEAFTEGTKTQCDSCPFGWNAATCACKVSCWS